MLGAIFVLFIVTYLPSLLVKSLDKCYDHPVLHILSYIINWSSVVINPIIYVVSQKKYQDAIMHTKNDIMMCLGMPVEQRAGGTVIPSFRMESGTYSGQG